MTNKINILMSSTSYPENPQDWKGRFIVNLVTALSQNEDLSLFLWAPPGQIPDCVVSATSPEDNQWLKQLSQRGGIAHVLRSKKLLGTGTALTLLGRLWQLYRRQSADVVHVNWLQNALPLWGTKTPALISVLGTDYALLQLPGMVIALRAMLKQRHAILAPNAEWMVSGLRQAFGDIAEIRPILFGVDNPWFEVKRHPMGNNFRHWLCITRLTKNKIGDLFAWGEGLFGTQRVLHLFGPMQEKITIPPWVDYRGPTHPKDLLQNWFPEACGLITLSRHNEGRPQVMLEAMAAGLPVIASDLPAHRDLIKQGQNGWIVPTQDALAKALTRFEDGDTNQSLGISARRWIKEHIGNWEDCAERYLQSYRDLLELP